MPVEERRTREEVKESQEHRFRVVASDLGPKDVGYDAEQTHEVHFFVGGKWKRVMLEDF
jgi:hypothetical protein